MKNEARLVSIIKEIDFGGLSRNKHFDAYSDPLVREARSVLTRVRTLADLLSNQEKGTWVVSLSPNCDRDGFWTLTCHSKRIDAHWIARLRHFELDMLKHYSRSDVIHQISLP